MPAVIFAENKIIIMIRNSLLIFFLCSSLFASSQTKVGTIDADYILNQMPEMSQVKSGLEEYNKELQGNLDETIKKYDTLVKTYQLKNKDLNAEERQSKEGEIIELENEIKGFRQRASVMMQMRRNELTKPLYGKIDASMKEVIQEENYTQILHAGGNSLAFAAEQYDITEKVMKKMEIKIPENASKEE
jgi:outer membrane protein